MKIEIRNFEELVRELTNAGVKVENNKIGQYLLTNEYSGFHMFFNAYSEQNYQEVFDEFWLKDELYQSLQYWYCETSKDREIEKSETDDLAF